MNSAHNLGHPSFVISSITDPSGNRVGLPVPAGVARRPGGTQLVGRHVRVEPLSTATHAADLWAACESSANPTLWTYMLSGPFTSETDFHEWVETCATSRDAVFYAVVDLASNRAVGIVSYLRIDEANRTIEVGHISYFDALARSTGATEAMTLMASHAFELGFRRYEWKCNVLNTPSIRAAERLGFSFEGVFRNALVVKGHNRDTAWFAMTDTDWAQLHPAHLEWLDPGNFDSGGQQMVSLRALTGPIVAGRFPTVSVTFS